ncbi:hypothetical protein [Streptomyces sp. NPDC088554]|uniref:hypothetical protein n=1 Tax=Streptomyces sp. NPDC088554 TaxID=3365865 RepID=UPI0038114D57
MSIRTIPRATGRPAAGPLAVLLVPGVFEAPGRTGVSGGEVRAAERVLADVVTAGGAEPPKR